MYIFNSCVSTIVLYVTDKCVRCRSLQTASVWSASYRTVEIVAMDLAHAAMPRSSAAAHCPRAAQSRRMSASRAYAGPVGCSRKTSYDAGGKRSYVSSGSVSRDAFAIRLQSSGISGICIRVRRNATPLTQYLSIGRIRAHAMDDRE